jgi:hypothetical protein
MKARVLLTLVIVLLLGSLSAFAADSAIKVSDVKISKLERYIYGDEQIGTVKERLSQIEEDLFGRVTGRKVAEKALYLHDLVFKGSKNSASLDMKLSFLEWKLFNSTGQGPLESRLALLDKQVIGSVSMEPLAFRLEQLIHLTIENGLISLHRVKIPRGTEIKLKLSKNISSSSTRKGDLVAMEIADDLFIDRNILTLAKGGIISARVKSVRKGGRFGRTGFVNLDISSIESIDATDLPVKVAYAGQERFNKKRLSMAAGASTLGYLVLGPIGLAGGAFIKGNDIEVGAGTEIIVRTIQDAEVVGVLVHRK